MLYDMKKTLTHSNEFKLYEKNMSPENKESFQNNARIKNFFQNINCCKSGSKDQKRFSNEILINAPKKEVDFKSFFRTVFEKSEEKKHSEDFMKTSQMSHLTSTKKQQNPISIQMNQRNNPHGIFLHFIFFCLKKQMNIKNKKTKKLAKNTNIAFLMISQILKTFESI